ncbi:MAG TPA: hypothetical protein VMT04_05935 [Terriglobales bacterium]|nr:hypothetical protein [Terriglobales bacterium]
MKTSKNIGLFLVISSILGNHGFAAQQAQQQTYTSTVILSAPWGQKNLYMDKELSSPGEFGIFDPYTREPNAVDQGPIQGPSTFTVAPNGDIYIVDTFNNRIQRFTQNGSFVSSLPAAGSGWVEDIAVDANGNIYLLYLGPAAVWKVDPSGNLLKVIYMFELGDKDGEGMSYGGGSTRLYCDKSGRLFLSYYKANERAQAVFQFGTTTTEFTPVQQKASLRKGSAGASGLILNKNMLFQIIGGEMSSVDNSGKSITEFKSLGSYSFLDVDSLNNAYLTSYNMENNIYSIRKQTPDGIIISTFEWKYPRYQLPSPHTPTVVDTKKELTIDAQGNVYVLGLTNSGLTITKWSPSGGK